MKLQGCFPQDNLVPQACYGAGEFAFRALVELTIAILRRYGWL